MKSAARILVLMVITALIGGCSKDVIGVDDVLPTVKISSSNLVGTWDATLFEVSKPDHPEENVDLLGQDGFRELTIDANGNVTLRTRYAGSEVEQIAIGTVDLLTSYSIEIRFEGEPQERDITYKLAGNTLTLLEEVEFIFDEGGSPERAIFRSVFLRGL